MTKTIEAVYEKGVFKPTKQIRLKEHQRVRLIVEDEKVKVPRKIINLASKVYENLTPKDIKEIELVALDRSNFSRESM